MMTSRRQFFSVLGSGLILGPVVAWLAAGDHSSAAVSNRRFPVEKSDEDWRRQLTPEQYRILRGRGTERAFTSPHDRETRPGTFACAACATELFSSAARFDSGTGWPSFREPLPAAVGTSVDRRFFMVRTEVHCAGCGGHLGHVFSDGPPPRGLRYCINGLALQFQPDTTPI